jgi:hypothetical protein
MRGTLRHWSGRATALILVGLLASATAGCSFLSVRGPPSAPPPSGEVKCTGHYGAPIGDALVGTLATAAAAVSLRYFGGHPSPAADGSGGSSDTTWAGITFSILAVAGVLVASSAFGFVQVARCSVAKDAARARPRQAWLPELVAGGPAAGPGPKP